MIWRNDLNPSESPTVGSVVICAEDLGEVQGIYRSVVCHVRSHNGEGFMASIRLKDGGIVRNGTVFTGTPEGYDKALAESLIFMSLKSFKLGWRWPRVILNGVSFGRTDIEPIHQRAVEVDPRGKDGALATFDRDQLARKVFDNLLPGVRRLPDNDRDQLFAAVRDDLAPIVETIIARATEAFEKKEVEAHNRKVRLLNLVEPIQEALWDGVTVEAVTNLAKSVEKNGRHTRPTLEEVLAFFKPENLARSNDSK
jgi:hypothetical protein